METDYFYQIDRTDLTRERPLGVTGILRCHNAADFLETCIDSCIEGLDELVAVYHDCTDDTSRILRAKQIQYADKIKVYEYKPYVFPMEMDENRFFLVKNLPSDSIHLISGYTNYALSKATYRYVVKIDADQIYFSDRWKRLCDAYRSTAKVRLNLAEYAANAFYRAYIRCFYHRRKYFFRWIEKLAISFSSFYFSYVEKRVIKDKVAVSLSGINLFRLNKQWMIGLGDRNGEELFPPFNGVGDHIFFELSEHTYFEKWEMPSSTADHYRVIDIMFYHKEIVDGGFFWFHMKPALREQTEKSRKMYVSYPDRFVTVEELKRLPYRAFRKSYHPFFALDFTESIFSYFHTAMRKSIPWNGLQRLKERYDLYINEENNKGMHTRDYYIEFYEELDKRLEAFAIQQKKEEAAKMLLGMHSVKEPLVTSLFYQLMQEKNYYNQRRLLGMNKDEAMKRVDAFLDLFHAVPFEQKEAEITAVQDHPWNEILADYKNQLLIYIFNPRQLTYLTPLIQKINHPLLLLVEYELSEDIELPEYVTALTLESSECRAFMNPYIEQCFPSLYQYANTFSYLLGILHPRGIICLEGCHMQEQLLGVMAHDNNIPAICIQQGWPSVMRTGFRRFPFRYFFTWGQRFCELWKKYNPHTRFIPMGYMYDVLKTQKDVKKAITFFLQAPFFISDSRYFDDIVELITDAAALYSDQLFLVREHSEYKLSEEVLNEWKTYPNIKIVSDHPLKEVYSRSLITVSHFSSCLMEGIIHDSIPLVYDPTTDSSYYPDLEKEGLGKMTKTKKEFHQYLKEILSNAPNTSQSNINHYLQTINQRKSEWCKSVGEDTLNDMVYFIHTKILAAPDDNFIRRK